MTLDPAAIHRRASARSTAAGRHAAARAPRQRTVATRDVAFAVWQTRSPGPARTDAVRSRADLGASPPAPPVDAAADVDRAPSSRHDDIVAEPFQVADANDASASSATPVGRCRRRPWRADRRHDLGGAQSAGCSVEGARRCPIRRAGTASASRARRSGGRRPARRDRQRVAGQQRGDATPAPPASCAGSGHPMTSTPAILDDGIGQELVGRLLEQSPRPVLDRRLGERYVEHHCPGARSATPGRRRAT